MRCRGRRQGPVGGILALAAGLGIPKTHLAGLCCLPGPVPVRGPGLHSSARPDRMRLLPTASALSIMTAVLSKTVCIAGADHVRPWLPGVVCPQ